MKQAKKYHEELNIKDECEYSEGWLQKFKCHGIKYLKFYGEKASTDYEHSTIEPPGPARIFPKTSSYFHPLRPRQ